MQNQFYPNPNIRTLCDCQLRDLGSTSVHQLRKVNYKQLEQALEHFALITPLLEAHLHQYRAELIAATGSTGLLGSLRFLTPLLASIGRHRTDVLQAISILKTLQDSLEDYTEDLTFEEIWEQHERRKAS